MEKILKIEETSFDGKDGFVITTDQQEIKLGIDNGQCCCENWGYFMSEDDLSDNTKLDEIFQFIITAKNENSARKKVENEAKIKYVEELELDYTECFKIVIENLYETTDDARCS